MRPKRADNRRREICSPGCADRPIIAVPSSAEQTKPREQPLAIALGQHSLCMSVSARADANSEVPARAAATLRTERAGGGIQGSRCMVVSLTSTLRMHFCRWSNLHRCSISTRQPPANERISASCERRRRRGGGQRATAAAAADGRCGWKDAR